MPPAATTSRPGRDPEFPYLAESLLGPHLEALASPLLPPSGHHGLLSFFPDSANGTYLTQLCPEGGEPELKATAFKTHTIRVPKMCTFHENPNFTER